MNSDLIQKLTKDLKPVPAMKPVGLRFAIWFGVSFGLVAFIMLLIQPFRPTFLQDLAEPMFLLETVLAFLPVILGAFLALKISIPGNSLEGRAGPVVLATLPFVLFGLFVLAGLMGHGSLDPTMAGKRATCVYEVLVLSWLPLLILGGMIKTGYVPASRKLGALVGVASVAQPLALMQLACMVGADHAMTFHLAPAIVVMVIAFFVAPWLLKPRV